jgi:hypothetical protein
MPPTPQRVPGSLIRRCTCDAALIVHVGHRVCCVCEWEELERMKLSKVTRDPFKRAFSIRCGGEKIGSDDE